MLLILGGSPIMMTRWQPIETAPEDREVLVYVAPKHGLEGFQCFAQYHPDAGWCCDELRETVCWKDKPADPIKGIDYD